MVRTPFQTRYRRVAVALITVVAAVSLTVGPAAAQEPQTGGTLTMARTADIFTFDPYNTQDDYSIFTELQVYERLVRLADDGTSVEPELAESWELAEDGLSATFTLREGVQFSDGTPLTVDDVVFSLTRAIDQEGSWGFLFSPVTSVSAVDDRTVKLEMSEPFAPLLLALSTFAASIYSKANFEEWGDQAGEHPLGTAAFMLDRWDKGSQVVLTRNPYYWQEGKPYLDQVVFTVVGDDNSRVLQLLGGQVDLIDFVPPNQIDQITATDAQLHRVDGTSVGWLTLNEAIAPLDEASVRCALAYAVDRQAIADNVYFGYASPALSVIPSSTAYYDPTVDPVTYDLDKARELLSQSSVPDGFELEAHVPTGDSTRLATAQIWAAALAELGVNLKITQVEATTAQELYNTEQYSVRISAWTNDTPDPDEMMGAGLDIEVQNALHTGYDNPEVKALVLEGRAELDPERRQEIYSEVQRIVNEECPYVYTVEVPRLFASTAQINGFEPNSQGKYGFEDVWKGS